MGPRGDARRDHPRRGVPGNHVEVSRSRPSRLRRPIPSRAVPQSPLRHSDRHRRLTRSELSAMESARIAQILDEMGTLLEVRGENPFRCRAYHNAAQALRALPSDLSSMIDGGELAKVPGIGETMLAKIVQLSSSGQLPAYDDLRR